MRVVPFFRVARAKLAVIISAKHVHHAIRRDCDGMVASCSNAGDIFIPETGNQCAAEDFLLHVTKAQLAIIISSESEHQSASR